MIYSLLNNDITQEEALNCYNVRLDYIFLPKYVNGFVFCHRGIYSIFINDSLSYRRKKETILHELAHIELNHLGQYDKDLFEFNVEGYEDEADFYINEILENLNYKF